MTRLTRPDTAPTETTYTYRVGMATATHHDRDHAFLLAFGLNLKLRRTAHQESQEKFADVIGVHRTFLGQLERGQRGANITLLRRICEALRVPPAELLPVLVDDHRPPAPKRKPAADDDHRPPPRR